MKRLYVVTSPQLGWDCVIGVYDQGSVTYTDLAQEYPYPEYIICECVLETEIERF